MDIETRGIILSKQQTTKALIRLRGCLCCSHMAKTGFLMTWLIPKLHEILSHLSRADSISVQIKSIKQVILTNSHKMRAYAKGFKNSPVCHEQKMSHVMRKPVLCHMRTTKAQISLMHSLISGFVVHCLDSIIPQLAIANI